MWANKFAKSATHTARDVYLLRLTRHNVDLASSSPLLSRPVKVRHKGTSLLPMWQALRATTAAPSYFAEVLLQSSSTLGGIEREAGVESDEADDADMEDRKIISLMFRGVDTTEVYSLSESSTRATNTI